MSLETYWLVTPLVGIALTLPLWAWLLTRRGKTPGGGAATCRSRSGRQGHWGVLGRRGGAD
jgi:hypothetical protein